MKLSELKTGMVIETRKYGLYLVLRDTCFEDAFQDVKDVFWRDPGYFLDFSGYDENMKRIPLRENVPPFLLLFSKSEDDRSSDWDIVRVYRPRHPSSLQMNRIPHVIDLQVLWEEQGAS